MPIGRISMDEQGSQIEQKGTTKKDFSDFYGFYLSNYRNLLK